MLIYRSTRLASLETCSCGDAMQSVPLRDLISDIHALDRELQLFSLTVAAGANAWIAVLIEEIERDLLGV